MKFFFFPFFIYPFFMAQAQHKGCIFPEHKVEHGFNLMEARPDGDFENIKVQKLALDSLSTGFLIWIKKNVPAHRHEFHSENVYILEGEGKMTLANDTFHIKAGSYVFIPTNAVHSVIVDETKGVMKVLSVQSPFFDGTDRVFVE
jgi:mannose-6-phosphate isomerase-like protein (cupin superfamily)